MARPPASTFGVADHDAVHVPPLLEGRITDLLDGKKIVLVSILRAGTGILDGMLSVVPGARVG